jgi:PhzF family phenazine biosynthesis protein
VEDDLCGHATLASAYVLALRGHTRWPVRFHTRSGLLEVTQNKQWLEMIFPAWPAKPCDAPAELLPALGVNVATVMKSVRDYLVVLHHADEVRAMVPDIRALAALDIGIGGVIVTAPGKDGVDYVCRFFPPSIGIDEDPATGSIQCALVPYWAARLRKAVLRGQQLSGRGGEFLCELAGERVKISGRARLYLQGVIEI